MVVEAEAQHVALEPAYFEVASGSVDARCRARVKGQSAERALWVAECGAEVIGFAEARVVEAPSVPGLRAGRRVYVEEIVVAEAARAKGCGKALVKTIEGWAKERRAEELVLNVWERNRGALAFYDAVGFEPLTRILHRAL